jgi:hypothetical protein
LLAEDTFCEIHLFVVRMNGLKISKIIKNTDKIRSVNVVLRPPAWRQSHAGCLYEKAAGAFSPFKIG